MTRVGQEPPSQTRVEFVMLCASAQTTRDGKLYVLGGGWSQTFRMVAPAGSPVQAPPSQFAIAASFLIDWNDASRPIAIGVTVARSDGDPALFELRAQVTAARGPQVTPGDP